MKSYFVLLHNFNTNKAEKYDIMPYLIHTYKRCLKEEVWWFQEDISKAPTTKSEFIHFVKKACMHRYWARCEYEWLMIAWPPGKTDTLEDCKKVLNSSIKIDAFQQIEMNLEIVTDIFIENIRDLDTPE